MDLLVVKVFCYSLHSRRLLEADHASGRSKDGLYEPALADSERKAVADLLQYLENVQSLRSPHEHIT